MAKRRKSLSSSSESSSDSDSSSSESDNRHRSSNKSRPTQKSSNHDKDKNVKPKEKPRTDEKRRRSSGEDVVDRRRRSSPDVKKRNRSSDRKHKSPERRNHPADRRRRTPDRRAKPNDRRNRSPDRKNRSSDKKDQSSDRRNRSNERPAKQKPRRDRSDSPKDEKKKNLFPIVSKDSSESEKKTITETTLISYPTLNRNLTEGRKKGEEDRKRRHSSPRFKSISSTITVTNNNATEPDKRQRRSPVQRQRSLRERVGWDPFQGTNSSSFGDHDDRQLSRGYNDSYTRKDSMGRGRGGRGGFRGDNFRGGDNFRSGRGGLWSNNRNFSRNNHETADRSGINDKKWKRDLFTAE